MADNRFKDFPIDYRFPSPGEDVRFANFPIDARFPEPWVDTRFQGDFYGGSSILALFANNEPGVWYDPSDMSTLFADTAGTTPATIGGTVALMLDKSGNDLHATQATAASRPTLRQAGTGEYYLEFDGVDDFMVTPTITPGTDKAQVFAGVRKLSDAVAILLETSVSISSNQGSLYVVAGADPSASNRYSSLARGSATPDTTFIATTNVGNAPDTAVITATHDIAGDLSTIRRNGVVGANGIADKGTGNFLAYPMYIGRRGGTTLPFNGHLYSLIARFGPNLDAAVIDQVEALVADKTAGVTLP